MPMTRSRLKPGLPEGGLRHGVERVGDDDEDASRATAATTFCTTSDMILKLVCSRSSRLMPGLRGMPAVMTTMSELARGRVVVGAGDVHVALLDGHGFEQVERLALRHAFDDVDQHDVGQFLGRDPVCGSGAHVAGAYDADFLPHVDFS